MTRQRFKKLTMALSIRIAEHQGTKVDGEMLRKQRNAHASNYSQLIKEKGSYQAAWDWMKPVRDTFGMD